MTCGTCGAPISQAPEYKHAEGHCIGFLKRQVYAYKQSFDDIFWMAKRYASGRQTYAPDLYNDALRRVMAVGFNPKPDSDGSYWADDPLTQKKVRT